MKHEDLNFKNGSVNPSGIAPIIYFIPKAHIITWPVIEDNPEDDAATVVGIVNYAGDFVLALDAKWARLYSTFGKGKVTSEPTGETDSKMFVNKGTFSYPKLTDEGRAFAKATANGDFVFVVKHNGKFYVIGHKDYPCNVSAPLDSGDAAGSAKGITISVECPDTTPMPKYIGQLLLSDGSLDCDNGDHTPTPAPTPPPA